MEPTQSTFGSDTPLWQGLEALSQRVDALERRFSPDPEIGYEPAANDIATVIRITKALFPGEVGFSLQTDPDYPGYRYPVVSATAHGEITGVEDRRLQWHGQVRQAIKSDVIWRLALHFQS